MKKIAVALCVILTATIAHSSDRSSLCRSFKGQPLLKHRGNAPIGYPYVVKKSGLDWTVTNKLLNRDHWYTQHVKFGDVNNGKFVDNRLVCTYMAEDAQKNHAGVVIMSAVNVEAQKSYSMRHKNMAMEELKKKRLIEQKRKAKKSGKSK